MRITGRLESGHTLTGIVGSNPTLSASLFLFVAAFGIPKSKLLLSYGAVPVHPLALMEVVTHHALG